uniref:Uncharacterized protein n=1 Tax=Mus spicilegus TaxID=10103 RepID=A0A8C6N2P5_MUSSI
WGSYLAQCYVGDASVEPNPLQMPNFSTNYGFLEHKGREGANFTYLSYEFYVWAVHVPPPHDKQNTNKM